MVVPPNNSRSGDRTKNGARASSLSRRGVSDSHSRATFVVMYGFVDLPSEARWLADTPREVTSRCIEPELQDSLVNLDCYVSRSRIAWVFPQQSLECCR